ncbi:MAG TPA: glycosyltransferase, partial [Patescibacteria group bacterium]|nr:glycosyltransferase [Patescibacteria group bacterium]
MVLFSYFPEDPRPRREAEALTRNGFEVDFFCLQRDPDELLREESSGISVYRLPLKRRRTGRLAYVFQYAAFLLAAFGFLTARVFRGYSIVHVHNMPDILVFSALVPKLFGAKVILDLHDPMPEVFQVIYNLQKGSRAVRALEFTEKLSIRFADAVLTPNIAFKDLFVSRGCPAQKIGIVMNSPDEANFHAITSGREQKTSGYHVMFHGTLVERNG